jgi:hypothetical protein
MVSTNWTPESTESTEYLPYQTASVYDSATDDYNGTTLSASDVDLTYDGMPVSLLNTATWTPVSSQSTNWTPT